MIEFAGGSTGLGTLTFKEQLRLARRILPKVVILLATACASAIVVGQGELAPYLLVGFDGIAFDQHTKVGMIWSSLLAAIVMLMVVRAGTDQDVCLARILPQR